MHLCAEKVCGLEYAHIAAKNALGDVMKIKKLLGFCESPGCWKFATQQLVIMRKSDHAQFTVKVCGDCAWKF